MKRLILTAAILLSATRVFAQTAPCDAVAATSGSIVAGQPMTILACLADPPPSSPITGWALYDGTVRTPITMVADTVVSTLGNGRQYSATLTAPSAVAVHTITLAAINATGEGLASSPFALTVLPVPPPPVPPAPTKLRIR
jgi:hypothetical protein